jgi:hypothetical protein
VLAVGDGDKVVPEDARVPPKNEVVNLSATFPKIVYRTGRSLPSGENEPTACTMPERSGQLRVSVQVWRISSPQGVDISVQHYMAISIMQGSGVGEAIPGPSYRPASRAREITFRVV